MIVYRISKYNPLFRDNSGVYQKNERTSFSDIGNIYEGSKFTMMEYLSYEKRYIDTIRLILNSFNISDMQIKELELNMYDKSNKNFTYLVGEIRNNQQVSLERGIEILTFMLKDILRCKLKHQKMTIYIGRDYYIHLEIDDSLKEKFNVSEFNIDNIYIEKI